MKEVKFLGNSIDNIRKFSKNAQDDLGYQLHRVQTGAEPDNWKPMNSIGSGVKEIRTNVAEGTYRTIYIAKIGNKIYVLHAFKKKTEKTAKEDIELAKKRLKEI